MLSANSGTAPTGAIIDRRDEESGDTRQSAEEQAKEPFPDAQKQLKYIVPAISIGVRTFQSSPYLDCLTRILGTPSAKA